MQQTEDKVIAFPPTLPVEHDRRLWISTGKNRYDKRWKNKQYTWAALLARLEKPTATPETFAEYMKMSKAEQDDAKDVGGFVGGTLSERKEIREDSQRHDRSLSFDLDFAPVDFYSGY
jgi:putative DNA primase/helicase